MALVLPYNDLSGVVDDAKLEENFDAIASKFNGGINDDDVQNSANININKLSARKYEFVLGVTLIGSQLNASTASFIVVGGIPYDTINTSYTICAIEHLTYTAGAVTAAVYDLKYGNHSDGFTAIKTGISTGTGSTQTAESSFTSSVSTSSTRPNFFILDVTTAGVSFAATDSWALSIKLKKDLRT
jgi:hypothetical protein